METIEGVREWRFPLPDLKFFPFLKSTFVHCRSLFYDLQKKFSFDIVNFHQPFTALGVLASKAARGIPRVYTCHSLSFEEFASRSSSPQSSKEWASYHLQIFARKLAEKVLLRKSNRIVVLSEYTREKILRKYGLLESKVEIIPGAVSLTRFSVSENKSAIRRRLGIAENCIVLLTIRNLVPRMGLENLIMALQLVLEERKDILLTVGGEGPLAQKLQDMAKDAGVDNFIKFTGFIPEKELASYYQMADLFILPTKDLEGFGMVTVEALASGLPVLGTPVGGTKEILGLLGPEFLFADSTPASMAELILKTIVLLNKDSEMRRNVSQKCRHVAERYYSWDTHIDQLEGLLQRMVYRSNNIAEG